jgi:AcrR family transcriptional regulator
MATEEKKLTTQERILEAAVRVFGEHGYKGATTREIARVAEVNETTLFRNFQNKEILFKAVVEQSASRMTEIVENLGMTGKDLRDDLTYFALAYYKTMEENEPLLRMLIGEARRQPEEAQLIAHNTWRPVKERMERFLMDAQKKGKVRDDVDARQAIQAFSGSIFAFALRRCMIPHPYTTEEYLKTVVDIFVRGIMPNPKEA